MAVKHKKRVESFVLFNNVFLFILGIIIVFPLYYTVVVSLTPETEYFKNPLLLFPRVIDFYSYQAIFEYSGLLKSFGNSLFIIVTGVAYNLFLTVTMAYGFSKKKFFGKRLFLNLTLFTMYFSGGLVPFYILIKNLKLIDSLAAVILPFGINVFYMIVMKSFFQEIPAEISEAARIDGAGEIRTFINIILPLSTPVLATFFLFYAVDRWNEWFNAMIFLNDRTLYPVQLMLREILNQAQGSTGTGLALYIPLGGQKAYSEGVKAASVMVVMTPVMLIYPFVQRYFIKGIMVGAVKG